MGCFTIDIFPEVCGLTTIVTEFGKFRHNIVPMVMCTYSNIFQAKLGNHIGDIKGFKTYIDNILVSDKVSLSQHIDQLIVIFARLRATVLKFNYPKYSFGLK